MIRGAGPRDEAQAPSPESEPPPRGQEPKLRLLAVDDDATILGVLSAVLEPDYEVVTALSAPLARAHLERGDHFDVIL